MDYLISSVTYIQLLTSAFVEVPEWNKYLTEDTSVKTNFPEGSRVIDHLRTTDSKSWYLQEEGDGTYSQLYECCTRKRTARALS